MITSATVSFIEFLLQTHCITNDQFDALIVATRNTLIENEIIKIIAEATQLDQNKIEAWCTAFSSYEQTDLENIDPKLIFLLPEEIVKRYQALVFAEENHVLSIAIINPLCIESIDAVSLALKRYFKIFLVRQNIIENKINALYRHINHASQLAKIATSQLQTDFDDFHITTAESSGETSHVAKVLGVFMEDAAMLKASDIHIEANDKNIIIRYRLGGVLLKQSELSVDIKDMLIRHILSRSDGNVSEMQLPQDTSFVYHLNSGEKMNLRVSTLNSIDGYSIVMRLLKVQAFSKLEEIIRSPSLLEAIQLFIQQGNGMFIVTGPTSSGKTTMLYNILHAMTNEKYAAKKVVSIEDPVEIILPGITQVQVNTKIGLDFGDIIKVSLRQNPDVLMLGEIRDATSALMAMRASITGVMVLSTLHTRDTTEVVLRLHDLGVPLPVIGNSLKLVVSTRLLRVLCERCKRPHRLTTQEIPVIMKFFPEFCVEQAAIFEAAGCEDCHHTGYRGLEPIYEFLWLDKAQILALSADDPREFQRDTKLQLGDKTLLHAAVNLWLKGHVSYAEVAPLIFIYEEEKTL